MRAAVITSIFCGAFMRAVGQGHSRQARVLVKQDDEILDSVIFREFVVASDMLT